jgi:hypothetical protein
MIPFSSFRVPGTGMSDSKEGGPAKGPKIVTQQCKNWAKTVQTEHAPPDLFKVPMSTLFSM